MFSYYIFSDSVHPLALPVGQSVCTCYSITFQPLHGFLYPLRLFVSPAAFCIPMGFLAPKGFWLPNRFLDTHRIFRYLKDFQIPPMGFWLPNGFLYSIWGDVVKNDSYQKSPHGFLVSFAPKGFSIKESITHKLFHAQSVLCQEGCTLLVDTKESYNTIHVCYNDVIHLVCTDTEETFSQGKMI